MDMRLILGLGLVAATLAITDAATYPVGKNGVWTFPASLDEYNTWASTINFTIGDVLVFNFPTGAHNVATVGKPEYDDCDGDSPLALATVGPASITLTTSGMNYFICTVGAGSHCRNGLNLAVNVTEATTGATPPPSSTLTPRSSPPSWTWTPSPSPSPSHSSSAPTVAVAGGSSFLVGMIGIVVMGMGMT